MNSYLLEALAVFLIIGVLSGFGYYEGAKHVQALWDADKIARAAALQKAVDALEELQSKQEAVTQAVQQDYETKLRAASDTSAALNALVLRYEAQLRRGAVPSAPAAPSGPAPAASVAQSDSGIDAAVAGAISACEHDSAQLGSLIDWVQRQTVIAR